MIKFVIPIKERHEQIKSNLITYIYCKIRLVVYMAQDELRNKSTGIIHNYAAGKVFSIKSIGISGVVDILILQQKYIIHSLMAL